ncbi:MAG TPA: VOC family protein [Acidimicrobiales bacterium]|nr:VOC family protein [Acidimicrobiales bacterium]
MPASFSHFGICVSDLERSLAFYCEGLGFEPTARHRIGQDFAGLMELDDVELTSQFVAREGTSIELLHFEVPEATGEPTRRPINRLGLTHLSLLVGDMAATGAAINRLGGEVLEATRTILEVEGTRAEFVYCTDPDGVRIELMHFG